MTPKQIKDALVKHAAWLRSEDKGERANLRWADLREANLRWADLREADLRWAKGYAPLPVADPRNYQPHAIMCDDGWHIRAGCRDLTIEQARSHWGDGYEGERHIGDSYLAAIDWLETQEHYK